MLYRYPITCKAAGIICAVNPEPLAAVKSGVSVMLLLAWLFSVLPLLTLLAVLKVISVGNTVACGCRLFCTSCPSSLYW